MSVGVQLFILEDFTTRLALEMETIIITAYMPITVSMLQCECLSVLLSRLVLRNQRKFSWEQQKNICNILTYSTVIPLEGWGLGPQQDLA